MEQKNNQINCEAVLKGVKTDVVESGAYKKVSELSNEELKKFPVYSCVFSRVNREYNGVKSSNYFFNIEFCSKFKCSEKITEMRFNNISVLLAPYFNLSKNLDVYTFPCYVRFVKVKMINKFNNVSEFIMAQCVITKKHIQTIFINNRDGALDLFNSLIKTGDIRVGEMVVRDDVFDSEIISSDSNIDLLDLF